jgi:predicted nucleic acid-binding protein
MAASRKLDAEGFTTDDAWARLSEFLSRAKSLHLRNHCSFWDAMIIAACMDCGVTRLYSEDLPGRTFEGLVIVNPFV